MGRGPRPKEGRLNIILSLAGIFCILTAVRSINECVKCALPCLEQDWTHDDVIKWKHFPRCWPFVRGIHPSPVNSPHKGQWRGALMVSLICVWIIGWVNNREAGDLRRYRTHYDVTVMLQADHIRNYRFDIWGRRSWPTVVRVMACCLMAPSHYLTQCRFIANKVPWNLC